MPIHRKTPHPFAGKECGLCRTYFRKAEGTRQMQLPGKTEF
jgi:hypothetical protein